jgi:hypothetical protein
MSCLQEYLQNTGRWEAERRTGPLFLSYAKPFKPVKSGTIAKYVLAVIGSAGIDIKTFTAHSTRGASTSLAYQQAGLSLKEISKAAGCSSCKTFAKHYKKPIVRNFGSAVLNYSVIHRENTVACTDHSYSIQL